MLGDPMKVTDQMNITETVIGEPSEVKALYRFTDIYNQHYWTENIPDIKDVR